MRPGRGSPRCPAGPPRGRPGELGDERPLGVEQLLGAVAPEPVLEQPPVRGVGPDLGHRDLVGAPRPLHRLFFFFFSSLSASLSASRPHARPARPPPPPP